MDSIVTPRKGRLARTLAKVLHIRAVAAGVSPEVDDLRKTRKKDGSAVDKTTSFDRAVEEAFLAKVFAAISSVKAGYAQLQYAQFPYDADGIQAADRIVVEELKRLSEMKQCYAKKEVVEPSPETALLAAEILEMNSLLKTYEITSKKMDSQIKLKESEIMFLKEKLMEVNSDNKLLEKRLNSSGNLSIAGDPRLPSLMPSHFIAFLQQTVRSVRSFVRLMIGEMESAGWDLDVAAGSIQPGVLYWKPNDVCFAYESFVCREMFDGFDLPYFSTRPDSVSDHQKRRAAFFERFKELKSVRAADYLALKPKSAFGTFGRSKYLRVIHPKMEVSFFGNLSQRNLVSSGEFPDSPSFASFVEMAKRVWLLHCLARSFDPEVLIFQVTKGSRFCEIYMESLSEEPFRESDPRVAFTVVPGFRIGKIVVQAQVYLA